MPYTDEQRSAAVALVAEKGLAEAWRETGIPKPTLAFWCDKAGVERTGGEKTRAAADATKARHELTRQQVRLDLIEKVADLLQRMDAEHVEFKGKDSDRVVYPIAPAGAVQNYATSVGILIDKYRLEMGEATGRTESRSLTDDLDDHEQEALRDAIDRELARRQTESAEGATAVEEASQT